MKKKNRAYRQQRQHVAIAKGTSWIGVVFDTAWLVGGCGPVMKRHLLLIPSHRIQNLSLGRSSGDMLAHSRCRGNDSSRTLAAELQGRENAIFLSHCRVKKSENQRLRRRTLDAVRLTPHRCHSPHTKGTYLPLPHTDLSLGKSGFPLGIFLKSINLDRKP